MKILDRREALRQILVFALPIIFGQIGIMLIGTGDLIVAGRYSRECLAAIGLAIAILNPIQISLLGLQFSIAPILAQKRGKGEQTHADYWTILLYSFFVSMVSGILSLLSYYLVPLLGYSPELNDIIRDYILVTSFSSVGLCIYQGIKEFFQAEEKTFSANILAILAAVFNVIINYALVFGALGLPGLKEIGLAWASLTVRLLMALGLFFLSHKFWKQTKKIDWALMGQFWKVGLPIAASMFFEVMAFCSVTLFVGKFAEEQIAANNIALNVASIAFMIPLSISSAVAVKVGHAYGERSLSRIRIYSQSSFWATLGISIIMASAMFFFPHALISFYTVDDAVLEWGKKILFWVACFQIFDGAQITLAGVLRGLSVTRPSSIAIFVGYWLIGIPLGYYLGFYGGKEAQGFWMGLAISLALVALMLSFVLKHKMRALVNENFS